MRVLLVNSHGADPTYGGAERYVRDLATGLGGRGHRVTILGAFPPREDVGVSTHVLHGSDWRDQSVRRLRNHAGDVVSAPWPRVRRALEATRPDLVHTSNLPGIGSGVWEVARRLGVPVVHTLHDYHLLCPRTSLVRRDGRPCSPSPMLCGLRTRRLARWAGGVSWVVAGSEHLLSVHRGLFPGAQERVIRLPLTPLDGGLPGPGEPPPALAALGYLGALTTTKGVGLLLDAAPALSEIGVELRIAGEGPLRARVKASSVRYVGRVEGREKSEFLSSCDAGVVPSLWEEPSGPPYVMCEWLAMRRPVLATRRGGLLEATRLGGAMPFDETASGLVEGVRQLLDPGEWERLAAATPIVEGDADLQRWLDEHEAAYGAAVQRATGRAAA